jgi:hypothetical protein
MSVMLSKALEGLGLLPGRTYRATVEGHEVEVRVLDDEPASELDQQVMLDGVVGVPVRPAGTVIARLGPLPLPDPPVIPPEDDEEVAL